MALRTADEYLASLRDGRTVYYRGRRVPDVTTHPVIGVAATHAAIDYELADDPAHRDLCVVSDEAGEYSRYYQIPRTPDDLLQRSRLIELATAEGATLVVLIKEIGTDALCGLLRVASAVDEARGTQYGRRVQDYYEHCRDNDPGRGRRADRRQGRPLPQAVRAGRSGHVRAHCRAPRRRHRGPRRQGAHVREHERQRADRPADARPRRGGRGLRRQLRGADEHARPGAASPRHSIRTARRPRPPSSRSAGGTR